jgi:putative transposase
MTLFRNKYRIETTRLRDWNYAARGWYFVTICIENKRGYFGRIIDAQQYLSALGEYAEACWREIPSHHKNVTLDEFIVMPNHVHGIIVIDGRNASLLCAVEANVGQYSRFRLFPRRLRL